MHSDHRRRYHQPPPPEPRYAVVPAADVYPGHTISTDQHAIDAVNGDRDADAAVDWSAVDGAAAVVRDRHRPTPTQLTFTTTRGPLDRATYDDVLLIRPHVER